MIDGPVDIGNEELRIDQYPFAVRPLSEDDGGGYLIEYPDIPGCKSDGETPEEAVINGKDALRCVLLTMMEFGDPIPEPGSSVSVSLPSDLRNRLNDVAEGTMFGRSNWEPSSSRRHSTGRSRPLERGRRARHPRETRPIAVRICEFADRYHISLRTLQEWEQGRSEPDGPVRAYLKVIARAPGAVRRALGVERKVS